MICVSIPNLIPNHGFCKDTRFKWDETYVFCHFTFNLWSIYFSFS